jgi:hypothetical protein
MLTDVCFLLEKACFRGDEAMKYLKEKFHNNEVPKHTFSWHIVETKYVCVMICCCKEDALLVGNIMVSSGLIRHVEVSSIYAAT